MIVEYIRATSIEEALRLIARVEPKTLPLGGGTRLNRASSQRYAVVDLQGLGLDSLEKKGNFLHVGATATLAKFGEYPGLQPALRSATQRETTVNLRQVATMAGTIVVADGRSLLTGVLLALDTTLELHSATNGKTQMSLGELLALRQQQLNENLIIALKIPLMVSVEFGYVSRTVGDRPIVYAALAQWPSGRVRLVLGGYGKSPLLVVDGLADDGLVAAACDAYSQAGDQWASSSYRQEMAGLLTARSLKRLNEKPVG